MKVLKILAFVAVLLSSMPSYSQSISEQIEAVEKAHKTHMNIDAKERKIAQDKERARKMAQEKLLREKEKREVVYEDTLREIKIENLKLDLNKKRSRVNRENDFINRELDSMDAKTDVVKSKGEGIRSISSGLKSFFVGAGEGKSKGN